MQHWFHSSLVPLCRRLTAWRRADRLWFLAILLIGIAVRVFARDSVPNGFNQDEASLGYDAWAILNYGVDRHGIAYPAFLIGWGSGMNALSAYLAMPFVALFGLTEGAVRAVNLLGGIASLAIFYLVVRRLGDAKLALWAAFLLAICPWHIMMSRWALESNLLPTVFLVGIWFLLKGIGRPGFLVSAGLSFAFALYAYGTAYFAVPVFLVMASCYLIWTRRIRWGWYGAAAALFTIVATPIAAVIWTNQVHGGSFSLAGIGIPEMPTMPRYKIVSSLFGPHALEHCKQNLATLWALFIKQDDGLFWNALPGYGLVYPIGACLTLLGLLSDLQTVRPRRSFQPRVLMLLWLVTAVALAAIQEGNINRLNLIWLPVVYYAAAGIRAAAKSRFVAVGVVAIHLAFFASFASTYFGDYRERTASAFFPSFGQAVNVASESVPGKVCVTNSVCFPYALVLFYERTDPREFAKTVAYEPGGGEFQSVASFGRFTFGLDHCPADTQAFVVENSGVDRFRDRAASIQSFSDYSVVVAKARKTEVAEP